MLKRCGSIAHHENHMDRRSYEPVAAPLQRIEKEILMRRRRLVVGLLIIIGAARFAQPRFRFSTTSMSRRTLMRVGDDIRVIRGSNVSKSFKKLRKKACHALASSARGELRATNALISSFKKRFKKVKKKLVRVLEI
jgi:hypothetical protein